MIINRHRTRRPLPFFVRWYEYAGTYMLLRQRNFDNPEARDRFARKLPKRPGFVRYT